MYTKQKFLAMSEAKQAKKFSDLLRVIILQLGNDVAKCKKEYEFYAEWAQLPKEQLLSNKNQAQLIDLYKSFRSTAGLAFERDVYLEQEPGDREEALVKALPYSVLIHNLRSAFNVGSIIRSIDCFGLESVNLSGYTPSMDHVSLKSAARGAEKWIPSQRWDSPISCIEYYKENNYEIIALETGDYPSVSDVSFPPKALILVGNEELGISQELMDLATLKVSIPMQGKKASMNVAGAFAITAFSIRSRYSFL
ncbi:MAG: RNA methyltransferase [Fibrobacter sp.]|jgi:tRNA G18 (ribose-2'-O)-methylase SpoU|nr:RNA methyltransferase [Fibrobacter sp.]